MSNTSPDSTDHVMLERIRAAVELLELIDRERPRLDLLPAEEKGRLFRAIAQLYLPDPVARRQRLKAEERQRSAASAEKVDSVLHETGIRTLRRQSVFNTPNFYPPKGFEQQEADPDDDRREAVEALHCYVCKRQYSEVHHFYDQMCPPCAALNFSKRTERADLAGRVALVTGARVKIGYQTGLKLLRCGAHLIVTTRFPRDSATRYALEPDFQEWGDRLEIYGLDLRHTPSVEAFCQQIIETHSRLDFIINNACQTVRRPPAFYQHMMEGERIALQEAPENVRRLLGNGEQKEIARGLTQAAELSQLPLLPEELLDQQALFPAGALDQDMQQIDLRGRNSWRLLMAEVSSVELLEVQLINAIAPYVLNARLKQLMLRTPDRGKHIVNVSAVEGQFYRNWKTTRHPHTNMAKAALNMMTRTSAADYHGDGIHMNSVDTGWVTDEDPAEIAARKTAEQKFHPPLDIVDGAARILDPIITGINTGEHIWGQFLKDYRKVPW